MSFVLEKIELNNIRAHEHFVFEPALEGITAISGENGSGKSTIVDSLAWVLYGTRVNNMRNKTLIKEGVNPKESPVNAQVTLISGGIKYLVIRKITTESGGVECNVWGKKYDSEGEMQLLAGPSVSHVETYIRQVLKMDEKGFLTSILIQQKQVDQIVSASPRERGETIEKMTGISTITKAISMANEENRSLQKAAAVLHVGNIQEASEKVEKQAKLLEDFSNKVNELAEQFNQNKEIYATKSQLVKAEKEKLVKAESLSKEIENLKTKNKLLQEQVDTDMELIQSHKKKYGKISTSDGKEIKAKLDVAQNAANAVVLKLNSVSNEINNLETSIAKIKDTVTKNHEELNAELKQNHTELETVNNEIREVKSLISEFEGDLKKAKSSLKQIDGDDKQCPVCKAEINDPEELKREIEREIESFKTTVDVNKEKLEKLKSKKDDLTQAIVLIENSIKSLAEAESKESKAKELRLQITELTNEHSTANATKMTLEAQYNDFLRIEADKQAVDNAKARSMSASSTIGDNANKIKELEAELETVGAMSAREFAKHEKEALSLQNKLLTLSQKGKEAQGNKKLAQERLNDFQANLEEVKITLARHKEMSDKIVILTEVANTMTEFKRQRIEYSIPTLEHHASDILNRFTGGAFTKLSLDDKFNTTVTTASGSIRPISQLSGGELSAAAIALRLGISLLLNGNERNTLIFDEVLVSMDEDRARHIMETISSMTNCQVIFIAHNTEINLIADKTVFVEKK